MSSLIFFFPRCVYYLCFNIILHKIAAATHLMLASTNFFFDQIFESNDYILNLDTNNLPVVIFLFDEFTGNEFTIQ